jgi:hypothetical protein
MLCKYPFVRTKSGLIKWRSKADKEDLLNATPFPCGKCIFCLINRQREWQARILLENRVHDRSVFLTLTYDDDHLPFPPSLCKKHVQDYIKRLRYHFPDRNIRYVAAGEYGTEGDRIINPHYHLALFDIAIEDRLTLKKCWDYGFIYVGNIEPKSAKYIVKYVLKNMTKPLDRRLRRGFEPEFKTSSKMNGGIGSQGIVELAKDLRRNPYWETKDIIRDIKICGEKLPLGRYLSKKLAHLLGIPQGQMNLEFKKYQMELIYNHTNSDDLYYESIINEEKSKRQSIEEKMKIWKNHKSRQAL